jgi:class 3 adenylate cyclase
MTASRRLAAILAADVAGYLRLMGADEEGTLERLKAPRRGLVDVRMLANRRNGDDDPKITEFAVQYPG